MIAVLAEPGRMVAHERLRLDPDEARHLAVRRARAGDPVTVLDGAGARGNGRLVAEGAELLVAVELVAQEPRPVELTLAIGAGDRDRFALIAEQAAQLDATRLVPIESARSSTVGTRIRDGHLERLRRRMREALKQCGAAWVPELTPPMSLDDLLAAAPAGARWLGDHVGPRVPELGPAEPLTVLVGPEGGFTAEERDRILSDGWTPVPLGPHILRFDTAALAALSTAWQARQRGRHGS